MALLAWVVHWSLRNRALVVMATFVFIVVGVYSAVQLPLDAVPDVTNVQVQVITTAPALSPIEIEQYVTVPVERAMAGIPHSTEVRSISKYSLSVVTIVFADGTDVYFARQLVNERMREAQNAVPAEYGQVTMGPVTSAVGEIYQFILRNDSMSQMQLEELLHWRIGPALRTVPGIVEVNGFGGQDRQYEVLLDPARLQAAGISVAEVAAALQRSNANAGGGYIEHEREHVVIGTDGIVRNRDDLERVVISATPQGVPITIATVGEVRFAPRLRRGAATADSNGEVVVGVALMLLGDNARTVTAAVKAKLAAIAPSLPAGTRIEPFYDRSVLTSRTIATVGRNLLEGAALVIAVLFLVLGDLRAGLVVATVIPLALLFAITIMRSFGISGNLMSLGAIDFGLIVDGAVIIVENAARRLGEERRRLGRDLAGDEQRAIVEASAIEVRSASVFGEIIIAIVYVPILTLLGVEGKMFRPMAETVLFALAGAFVLSLTLVPVLTSYVVRPAAFDHETRLVRIVQRWYGPVLERALRWRAAVVGAAVLATAAAVALFTHLGAEFVPKLDEGDIVIEARRLPGASLAESVETSTRLEKLIREIPEVRMVVTRIGSPEVAVDPMGIEAGDVYVELRDREAWRPGVAKADIVELIAKKMARIPEVSAAISQPIEMRTNELIAGVKSDIAIVIYGPDLDELRRLGDSVNRAVSRVKGAVDVRTERVEGLKYLTVTPQREKLARYGLSIDDVNQLVETIAVGLPAGTVLEGERRFAIVVRTRTEYAGEPKTLAALPLKSVTGQIVPLGDVATLTLSDGPVEVNRSQQSRRLNVEVNVRGRDLLSVVADAQAAVSREVTMPAGYHLEWGGQFESYQRAQARLEVVVPLALMLIVFMLWLAFRAVRPALLVFATVPCAIVGGVVALWLRGLVFSISAGVGFIALSGVAVLNGLVLVTFARQREAEGVEHTVAAREAARARLRPVLMTALVAALGFVPMAVGNAPGSEVQRPLATVVIGGIISATVLTLVLLPVLYAWLGRARRETVIARSPPSFAEEHETV